MAFRRHNITKSGLAGLAEKYINDNFMALFSKVSGGNINYADLDTNVKNRINTQWIPFQAEGNLDANFPLETRIYLPPNVKEIKSATMSAVASNYRMDSDVALSDDFFSLVDVNIAMGGATTVIGNTTTNGGGSINESFYVEEWGTPPYTYDAPTSWVYENGSYIKNASGGYVRGSNGKGLGTIFAKMPLGSSNGELREYVDFKNWQHTHKVIAPSHSHGIQATALSHSHEGYAKLSLPKHSHKLNEGVKVSTKQPSGIELQVNDRKVGRVLSGTNDTVVDVDILKECKVGWNHIKVLGMGVGRITIYGVIEIVVDTQYMPPTDK